MIIPEGYCQSTIVYFYKNEWHIALKKIHDYPSFILKETMTLHKIPTRKRTIIQIKQPFCGSIRFDANK